MLEGERNHRREVILEIIDKAMSILRDNRPFDAADPVFGVIRSKEKFPDLTDTQYIFKNSTIPGVIINFSTVTDPLDYSEDRTKVSMVPRTFDLRFISSSSLLDISPAVLKKRLDLADYWVAGDGTRYEGNDLGAGSPPTPRLHTYRYRANARPDSRFSVDVDLLYGDDGPTDPTDIRVILQVTLSRAYPYLTPEMRKQKREENERRARDLYGNPRGNEF